MKIFNCITSQRDKFHIHSKQTHILYLSLHVLGKLPALLVHLSLHQWVRHNANHTILRENCYYQLILKSLVRPDWGWTCNLPHLWLMLNHFPEVLNCDRATQGKSFMYNQTGIMLFNYFINIRQKSTLKTSSKKYGHFCFNPFPHTAILQQTTLNAFCRKIENLHNWMDNLWLKVENIVAKGEIAHFICGKVLNTPI